MKKYLLVDLANMFFRSRHVAFRASSAEEKAGYALHICLGAINKMVRKFSADHVVFALEGRSWRKDFYEPYKKNRSVSRAARTEQEQAEDELFWSTFDEFCTYLAEQTNCSVIRHEFAEADDIIARFIALHDQDHHTIISTDTDFVQLLNEHVQQYNGVTDELITIHGIFDDRGRPIMDNKTKAAKVPPDPAWLLFEKCMRGDSSDNVFSAYPGVRTRGTRNKVGLQEAFEDRERRGYAWNTLMLSRWTDHNNQEHRVLDDYNRNVTLIDLTAQPDHVKQAVDQAIRTQVSHKHIAQVGVRFMKFCGRHDLIKVSESADQYGQWLNAEYQGVLNGNHSQTSG